MGKSLFELTSDALAIDAVLEHMGGDISDEEVERFIDDLLAEHTEDLHAKLDGYVTLIAEYDARVEVRLAEAKRYKALAEDAAVKSEKLRERLKLYFERTGRAKVETGHHVISLVSNGGKVPLRLACPPEMLPPDYRKETTVYSADQDAIRKALESGQTLAFAALGERGKSIRIK